MEKQPTETYTGPPLCPLTAGVMTHQVPVTDAERLKTPNIPAGAVKMEQEISFHPCMQQACMMFDSKRNDCAITGSLKRMADAAEASAKSQDEAVRLAGEA